MHSGGSGVGSTGVGAASGGWTDSAPVGAEDSTPPAAAVAASVAADVGVVAGLSVWFATVATAGFRRSMSGSRSADERVTPVAITASEMYAARAARCVSRGELTTVVLPGQVAPAHPASPSGSLAAVPRSGHFRIARMTVPAGKLVAFT